MCNDGLLDMTRGYDRRETFQVHSATESRLKYKYEAVLHLKMIQTFAVQLLQRTLTGHTGLCAYRMTEEIIKTHTQVFDAYPARQALPSKAYCRL